MPPEIPSATRMVNQDSGFGIQDSRFKTQNPDLLGIQNSRFKIRDPDLLRIEDSRFQISYSKPRS
jgi:hypothetical protein